MKRLKPLAFVPAMVLMVMLTATRAGYGNEPVLDVLASINPSFELTDRNGALVKETEFRGKHVLVGFGFTHCGHICPTCLLYTSDAADE